MYLTKTPKFIQSLFPSFTWRGKEEKEKNGVISSLQMI